MALASQGTTLEIGTGSGSAVTITVIGLGNPTILTSVAHGLSNGDVVAMASFAGDDAASINGNSYVVQFETDDTFAIDLDSSALTITDNTDSATATPVTWTTVGEVIDMDRAAGERADIETTHLTSTAKEYMLGLKDSGNFTFSLNWLFSDAGQTALIAAEGSDDEYDFKVTYPSTDTMTFSGYVKSVTGPSLGVDDKLNGSATIRISGDVTFA